MQLVEDRPNVELRRGENGGMIVVLAFPYDPHIVAVVRGIPQRRFDWDRREWWAPVDDWAGVHVADVLARFPELTTSPEVDAGLPGIKGRWVGRVTAIRHDGRGWWALDTRAGTVPAALLEGAAEHDGIVLAPLTLAGALALEEQDGARIDAAARRCMQALQRGDDPPPARLALTRSVEGDRLRLDVLWDPDIGVAFGRLPGTAEDRRTLPVDPWVVTGLDAFLARHGVEVDGAAAPVLAALRAEHDDAAAAIRWSRATDGAPIDEAARVLGGELQPFQWAGVRYVLDARRAFLADEQGLGKTVEALAAIEADDAYPAVVVCPASLKLNWEREAARWLPHRSRTLVQGKAGALIAADITILNYEIVAAHRDTLARLRPRALVVDESHYVKNPQAKRTHAVRRLAGAVVP